MRIVLYTFLMIGAIVVITFCTPWTFDKSISFAAANNPLWDSQKHPTVNQLTRALTDAGFTFQVNRGAEADPDGICYGYFAKDEYWVIQYHPDARQVSAYAWILNLNPVGHFCAAKRFAHLTEILEKNITNAEQGI